MPTSAKPRKQLDVAEVSKIAEEITGITSFQYGSETIDHLLEVLQKQPLVSAASLWKIKRRSGMLCAKGRTKDIFDPDPMDPNFAGEFVFSYQHSVIAQIIDSSEFQNHKPYTIRDLKKYEHDGFFRGVLSNKETNLTKAIFLPLKSYMRPPSDNPAYFLVIYISEEREETVINESLLNAIANKASSTLSTQIERNQNRITDFIKETTMKSPNLTKIMQTFMSDIVPKYFNFVHAILLWKPSGSLQYECLHSSKGASSQFSRNDVAVLAQTCIDSFEGVSVVFDADIFSQCCPDFLISHSAIVAPISNHVSADSPQGFVILIDKLSPLALRQNQRAKILDRFDWEDELMMTHAISMISMVVELLHAEDRRKHLADQIAHEVDMPANYIYSTAEELVDDFDGTYPLSRGRRRRYLTNIQTYAKLQLALCDGILIGLRNENAPRSERYDPSKIDLQQLVRDVARITFPFCQQHDVKNDNILVSRTLPVLYVDQAAFTQVFLNLVTNAIKYSGDKGFDAFRVSIECEPATLTGLDPKVVQSFFGRYYRGAPIADVDSALQHGYLITIEDDGIGIKSEYSERVFQRHFREPGVEQYSARGSGLGLSIVRRIIADHYGAIWLESNANPTRFAIYLPSKVQSPDYTKEQVWTRGGK